MAEKPKPTPKPAKNPNSRTVAKVKFVDESGVDLAKLYGPKSR